MHLNPLFADFSVNSFAEETVKAGIFALLMTGYLLITGNRGQAMEQLKSLVFWAKPVGAGLVALWFLVCFKPPSSVPDLRAEITDLMVGQQTKDPSVRPSDDDPPAVTIGMRVGNGANGAPSVALKWRLRARLANGVVLDDVWADPRSIGKLIAHNPQEHPEWVLSPDRYLPLVLAESPIMPGANKYGWVQFVFPLGVTRASLMEKGAQMTVIFEDSNGRSVTAERKAVGPFKKY